MIARIWRQYIVGIDDAQFATILVRMLLIAQEIQYAAHCPYICLGTNGIIRPGVQHFRCTIHGRGHRVQLILQHVALLCTPLKGGRQ